MGTQVPVPDIERAVGELVTADIRVLCERKSCEVLELNVREGHIHPVVRVFPRLSISKLMGTLKGKMAIKLIGSYPDLKKKPYRATISGRGAILRTRSGSTGT